MVRCPQTVPISIRSTDNRKRGISFGFFTYTYSKERTNPMRYNRHDYFRYTFNPYIPATFRIQLNNEERSMSNEGNCEILDISTGGVKFVTHLDLPVRLEILALQLEFTIYQHHFEILGNVAWKKETEYGFEYGFEFDEEQKMDALITEELKHHARKVKETE
ncbi:hypothetical protein CSV67_07960 [Sporosarcina sp. P2]|nr:hypothetical protein CSV67_07960 [Sporosarcina sp. P2]